MSNARHNLGTALRKTGRVDEAAAAYEATAALAPDLSVLRAALADTLMDLGRLDEALNHLRRRAELEPDSPAARSALLYTLHYHPDYDAAALCCEHVEWGMWHGGDCGASLQPALLRPQDRCPHPDQLRVGYISPDFRDHTVPGSSGRRSNIMTEIASRYSCTATQRSRTR